MKTVILKSLTIDNFKGFDHFSIEFSSGENTICGENGSGKTTLHNAWQWLMLENVKDFIPTINGIESKETVSVMAHIAVNGKDYTICRQKPYGKDFIYFIDGLNVKFTQYKNYILDWFGLETHSQLILLSENGEFNNCSLDDKRKKLIDIAGATNELEQLKQKPKYREILEFIEKGYSVSEMADTLRVKRKKTKAAQDRTNNLIWLKTTENSELSAKYDFDTINSEILKLEMELNELQSRSRKEYENAELEASILKLGSLNEQLKIVTAEKSIKTINASQKVSRANADLIELENQLTAKKTEMENAVLKVSEFDPDKPQICPFCKSVVNDNTEAKERTQKLVDLVESLQIQVGELEQKIKNAKAKKLSAISELNMSNAETDIEKELKRAIFEQKKAIREAKDKFLDKSLDSKITSTRNKIYALQSQLAFKQIIETNNKAIEKWKRENIELADELLAIMKTEQLVREYSQEQTRVLEDKINAKFGGKIKWLLSERKEIDGEIVENDTCECMLNGVRYCSLSNGEKSLADIEIIKSLQKMYSCQLPLWCDDSESVTKKYDYNGQVIKLFAKAGANKLAIT